MVRSALAPRDASQPACLAIGELMKFETITQRPDLVIRRHILEPGEALPWHTDLCHRFTVVMSGEALSIEYRDTGETESFPVHAGLAD